MPFGLPYNEAANPRAAAPVRAWLTAAATTVTCQHCHTFHITHLQNVNISTNKQQKSIALFTFSVSSWCMLYWNG